MSEGRQGAGKFEKELADGGRCMPVAKMLTALFMAPGSRASQPSRLHEAAGRGAPPAAALPPALPQLPLEKLSSRTPLEHHLLTPMTSPGQDAVSDSWHAGSTSLSTPTDVPTASSGDAAGEPLALCASRRGRVNAICGCTELRDCLMMVGADAALGAWDCSRAATLSTSPALFPAWYLDLADCHPVRGSEFKLVILQADGTVLWEPIEGNRTWPADADLEQEFTFHWGQHLPPAMALPSNTMTPRPR